MENKVEYLWEVPRECEHSPKKREIIEEHDWYYTIKDAICSVTKDSDKDDETYAGYNSFSVFFFTKEGADKEYEQLKSQKEKINLEIRVTPLDILESFRQALIYEIIKGDGDEEEDAFTRGYNCACDSHVKTIQMVFEREVKKYYES